MCDEKINNIFFLGLIVQLVKKFDVFKNLKLLDPPTEGSFLKNIISPPSFGTET